MNPRMQVPNPPTMFKNATKLGMALASIVIPMTINILSVKHLRFFTVSLSKSLLKNLYVSIISKQHNI